MGCFAPKIKKNSCKNKVVLIEDDMGRFAPPKIKNSCKNKVVLIDFDMGCFPSCFLGAALVGVRLFHVLAIVYSL